jgi:hypothetical protein
VASELLPGEVYLEATREPVPVMNFVFLAAADICDEKITAEQVCTLLTPVPRLRRRTFPMWLTTAIGLRLSAADTRSFMLRFTVNPWRGRVTGAPGRALVGLPLAKARLALIS